MSNKKLEIYLFALIEHIQALPQCIPCFKEQAAGAVFAVLLLLFFFQDAEGFAGESLIANNLWIEYVTKFITG
jgi:hypothetical protein